MPRMRRPRREQDGTVAFEPQKLSGLFAPARWLRDLGRTAWLLVGVALFVVGVIWLLSLTQTIVMPVITAAVVAAVCSPVVRWLATHRVKRGLGAALVLLALVAVVIGMVVVVVGGITSQKQQMTTLLEHGRDTIAGWAHDAGLSQGAADDAKKEVTNGLKDAVPALLHGLGNGIKALSSLVFFLALLALSLFFLLMDGPTIRDWTERHMRVPPEIAHGMTGRVLQSLRGYFFGVTIVAAFNAAVVGLGALILGVPMKGTIMAVTFVGAYIPYLGAWGAGAFSVVMALGGAGTSAAVGMIVVQLLANGLLQQLVQPVAYGAALGIHPLAVLIVTIAGGSLFGTVGLVLAAPLVSAANRIAGDLSANRSAPAATPPPGPPAAPPVPPPTPAVAS